MFAARHPGDYSKHDAEGRMADAVDDAHERMQAEFCAAFLKDPRISLPTPGRTLHKSRRVLDLIADDLVADSPALIQMLELVRMCCDSADLLTRLKAQALVAELGKAYADDYAEEAVQS